MKNIVISKNLYKVYNKNILNIFNIKKLINVIKYLLNILKNK